MDRTVFISVIIFAADMTGLSVAAQGPPRSSAVAPDVDESAPKGRDEHLEYWFDLSRGTDHCSCRAIQNRGLPAVTTSLRASGCGTAPPPARPTGFGRDSTARYDEAVISLYRQNPLARRI